MKIYLVRSWWGAYSDAGERIEKAFTRRERAVEWIKEQTCEVYDDGGEVYASFGCEDGIYQINPTRHREWWPFECIGNIDTPKFEVVEMEVE